MLNRTLKFVLVVGLTVILVSEIPTWSQPKDLGGSAIEHVEPPKGSTLRFWRDNAGSEHYEYLAPPNFNENPIHIYFEQTDPNVKNPKPDVYVWADVIHWNNSTQSATATGRIVVDSKDYRIETSYAEYNHITRQIYCPKRVVIIQKAPNGRNSRMEAESAVLKLDDDGIKDAKFDKIVKMYYFLDRDNSPIKSSSKTQEEGKGDSSSSPPSSGLSGPAD